MGKNRVSGQSVGSRGAHFLTVLILVAIGLSLVPPASAKPQDVPVPGGRVFMQTAAAGGGFSVLDADGIAFWTAFQSLGGVDRLGYPISQRVEWKGALAQFFQKGALIAPPGPSGAGTGPVTLGNLFDDLHADGFDDELLARWGVPRREWLPDEQHLSWEQVVERRLALLDDEVRFRRYYDSFPDPMGRFGLPTSPVYDAGPFLAIRLQRAVFQLWKTDGPDIRAGTVTVVNGGDMAKALGIIPSEALSPEDLSPPEPRSTSVRAGPCPPTSPRAMPGRTVIALDPGHGGVEIGSIARFSNGATLAEKTANLQIALRAAEMLRQAGFGVVLTRETDARVNARQCDATGDNRFTTSDDLQMRLDIANAAGAAVFVSIHNNGHNNRDLRGTEVYYSTQHPLAARNRELASQLQRHLVASIRAAGYPTADRGIRTDQSIGKRFFLLSTGRQVVRPGKMPAALGETLFLTNPADAAALRRPEVVEAIARGYVQGIRAFLGQ